ncbi:hypothetical protein RJ641_029393 [Dillenia turbinata]|uniref:Uncharacterized protein n=1 Tax=Dillenia turbinata TaxID=194707 RepID=A0AAN8W1N1_9MAGN
MENSTMEEPAVASVDASTPPPEKKTTRRRLIQSTLFLHRSPENENEDCDEEEREDEECGGSQTKQKRKRRARRTSQCRASNKNVMNDIETLNGQVADKDFPVTIRNEFFVKVSERLSKKKNQKEESILKLPEGNDKNCCSPSESVVGIIWSASEFLIAMIDGNR